MIFINELIDKHHLAFQSQAGHECISLYKLDVDLWVSQSLINATLTHSYILM